MLSLNHQLGPNLKPLNVGSNYHKKEQTYYKLTKHQFNLVLFPLKSVFNISY